MTAPTFDGSFQHNWTAEILPQRPLILPSRQYIYPAAAEEVERGALEVLVRPKGPAGVQPFLATCALGFRDAAAPTGLWAMPHPDWLCAVSGGYPYLIDVTEPSRFVFLRYRPVLQVLRYSPEESTPALKTTSSDTEATSSSSVGLLLFAGHYSVLAWGRDGETWESDRLSWEGLTNLRIAGSILQGEGWDLVTDREIPFAIDLRTGKRL